MSQRDNRLAKKYLEIPFKHVIFLPAINDKNNNPLHILPSNKIETIT